MDVVRWILEEVETGETHTVELNPNEMASYLPGKEFEFSRRAGVRMKAVKLRSAPVSWNFGGVTRTESHHDSLIEWQKKPGLVRVTDHLGRTFEVMMEGLDMVDRRPAGDDTWRHRYTFTCLLLRRVA